MIGGLVTDSDGNVFLVAVEAPAMYFPRTVRLSVIVPPAVSAYDAWVPPEVALARKNVSFTLPFPFRYSLHDDRPKRSVSPGSLVFGLAMEYKFKSCCDALMAVIILLYDLRCVTLAPTPKHNSVSKVHSFRPLTFFLIPIFWSGHRGEFFDASDQGVQGCVIVVILINSTVLDGPICKPALYLPLILKTGIPFVE